MEPSNPLDANRILRFVRAALVQDGRLLGGSAAFALAALIIYRIVIAFGLMR